MNVRTFFHADERYTAIEFTRADAEPIAAWCGGSIQQAPTKATMHDAERNAPMRLEPVLAWGTGGARLGQWVVQGPSGHLVAVIEDQLAAPLLAALFEAGV